MAAQYTVNGRQVSKEEYQKQKVGMKNLFGFGNPSKGNGSALDNFKSTAPKDGVQQAKTSQQATWGGYDNDWRVKISYKKGSYDNILAPLAATGGLVFPYTPTVIVNHTANYDSMHPIHSNYPFYAYQNSQVDQITITGDFVSQTQEDAQYWVAAMHFLRSSSKMSYGESSNQGNPPPLLQLNGYGQFVFNNVPVVLQTFMLEMPNDVDYIETIFGDGGTTMVPTRAQLAITVSPQYSRRKVETFSLDSFVRGDYLKNGGGFI
jgi:hypothetical protein